MERYKKLCTFYIRNHLYLPVILSILLCCLTPCFMGTHHLNSQQTAKILESFVCFIGVILLMTVYMPEIDHEIRDLIRSKRESMLHLYILRFLLAFIVFVSILLIYLTILKNQNCTFPFPKLIFGTIANGLFLSGLGMLAYSLFDQIVLAYMLPFAYYMLNYGDGKHLLGKLFLFSMTYGEFEQKHYLFVIGCLMIGSSMVISRWKR